MLKVICQEKENAHTLTERGKETENKIRIPTYWNNNKKNKNLSGKNVFNIDIDTKLKQLTLTLMIYICLFEIFQEQTI